MKSGYSVIIFVCYAVTNDKLLRRCVVLCRLIDLFEANSLFC